MLDVDTGVDDAMAIALAVGLKLNLIGVSTVSGNVDIDRATENTRRILGWLRAGSIPIHRGASRPLAVPAQAATHVHGENGLGGAEFPGPAAPASRINGVQAILVNAEHYSDELTLVALGPLTNVAQALSIRPALVHQIRRLIVMNGAFFTSGNVTPHAEFNAYADPHAAAQVLEADWMDVTAVGLDVTHSTIFSRHQWETIEDHSSRSAQLVRKITARTFTERGMDGFYVHDALALATAFQPDLIGTTAADVEVLADVDRRGKTVAHVQDHGNVKVATTVDVDAFDRLLAEALGITLRKRDASSALEFTE
jgi:inosine-uridine nucleoside N-ribohydrolase